MINAATFDPRDVVRCYAPPNLYSVMPGNRVMLRSGGPEMIVTDVDSEGKAVCKWMAGEELQVHVFDLMCLTCFGAR